MIRKCLCGADTIVAREIDNAIRVVDAGPTLDLESVVLLGDMRDEPTALWGIDPAGDDFYGIPADAPRYRKHECASP